MLQQSQHTPSVDHVTGLSHKPHGKTFAVFGPGFDSMSPDSSMMSSVVVKFCLACIGNDIGLLPL